MFTTLLRCAAPDPERARLGRILAAMLLIFIGLTLFSVALAALRGSLQINPVVWVALGFLILFYFINRQGRVTLAATGLILMIIGVMVAVALMPTTSLISALLSVAGLVIPISLAGVMMPWRGILGVLVVASVATVVLYQGASPALQLYEQAQPGGISGSLGFALVILWSIGGLAALASSQIWQALGRLEQRNADLTEQSARERALIAQMRTTAVQVREAAGAIATAATQQTEGASEQAAAISQVSGTIEELNQTAQQIATIADTVAAAAEQALQSARHGQDAVRAGIRGMTRITERINDIVARNMSLTSQSRRIEEILTTINEIAAQTHILALNAAIESAGAGAAGSRFAVIAGEVRSLAQHSTAATREIQVIITQHQAAIAAAVLATEEGLKEGAAGLTLAEQNDTANAAIIVEVERTAQLMHTINLATQQQRTASAQVVLTMHEMVDVTQQAAVGSRQTLEAVQQLDTAAQALVLDAAAGPADAGPLPPQACPVPSDADAPVAAPT